LTTNRNAAYVQWRWIDLGALATSLKKANRCGRRRILSAHVVFGVVLFELSTGAEYGVLSTQYGFFGSIVRRAFFGRENFDERPAITYDQFRRWAAEADRDRQQVEDALDRLRRIFGR